MAPVAKEPSRPARRIGLGIPKQLLKIAGRPIMEHTLAGHSVGGHDHRDLSPSHAS
jgi:hypothetical protein